ncbi:WD40 repeat-like protein [Lichtheimia hyalospora FSU 10163]|nr:WD40 repeat-like protein [Lichtheimia hyalospora FSU 10163]
MATTISWPLVVWHNFSNPTTTCVTCSYPNVYAGQRDGHIWVYTMHNAEQLQYKLLLVGHRAPIAALCVIKGGQRANDLTATSDDILVSASEDGEIAQWNASDGRCLGVNAKGFLGVPTDLKLFSQAKDRYIFCSGQSNEINILNATTLEVVRVWGSHPNWVTCADFYDPVAKRSRLVTVTMDGKLDIWDFDVAGQVIYKDRSSENQPKLIKETTSDRVIGLKSCPFFHGLCMVLTRKNAIVFVLRDSAFVPEVTIPAEHGTSWSNAEFCKGNKLLIWAQNGKIFEYYLKPPAGVDPGSMAHDENQLYYSVSLMHTYYFDTAGK